MLCFYRTAQVGAVAGQCDISVDPPRSFVDKHLCGAHVILSCDQINLLWPLWMKSLVLMYISLKSQ